jgi:hypothetical protein
MYKFRESKMDIKLRPLSSCIAALNADNRSIPRFCVANMGRRSGDQEGQSQEKKSGKSRNRNIKYLTVF